MKKHILTALGLFAACTMSATQYMHINLPDGKEYDVKVEKTDRVSHVKDGDEIFIKVTRTDGSSTLYSSNGAEVTFDEEIARMDGDVANWDVKTAMENDCIYDTSIVQDLRERGASEWEIREAIYHAQKEYSNCVYKAKDKLNLTLNGNEVDAIRSANKIATAQFWEIAKEEDHKDKNLIFSPTSLQFALAMLVNGADDDSAYAEITKMLGQQDMPLDFLNNMYEKRMNTLITENPMKVEIGVANAAFLQNGIHFGKNYLQSIEEYYKAAANNVDFALDTTYKLMDKWAEETTNGMIPSMQIPKNPALWIVLANALSFQAEWANKFDRSATISDTFTTATGEKKRVEKMRNQYEGGYAEGDNYQLVTLGFYEGYVMNVILPNEGVTPETALAEIDLDSIHYKRGHTEMGPDTIYCPSLSLPKFNLNDKIELNESLKKIGLENTFSKNFNNIANGAHVTNVKQLTHLEIDEDGAKGAAVTTISMEGAAMQEYKHIKVDVNRPFIVTINNPHKHEILFIGLINDPSAEQ
ncbi:MAG: serpin family protein [Paludibacteraceae bacterium]|nr:serpin family protein [Paludibacteraceae bacterium]